MATLTTDGSWSDLIAKYASAADGDTVMITGGDFTGYGAGGTQLIMGKAVTVKGMGPGVTNITLSDTGPTGPSGVFVIAHEDAVLASMTIVGSDANAVTALQYTEAGTAKAITYVGGTSSAYFLYFSGYGKLLRSDITGNNGSAELIFGRGPGDAWLTGPTIGTNQVFMVEGCHFRGQGYICDANSNARMTIRFCVIHDRMKIDGHGKASNGDPARGVRQMEVYEVLWDTKDLDPYHQAGEFRGGLVMMFNCRTTNAPAPWLSLRQYEAITAWEPNFPIVQTPFDRPIDDQIGVGPDPKVAASEPSYIWGSRQADGTTIWAADVWFAVLTEGIARYKTQTGDPDATYVMGGTPGGGNDIIREDQDYFTEKPDFDGTSGIGIGTRAEMDAITPLLAGVGFWVTDEGDWHSARPGASGRLYRANEDLDWELFYTPLAYIDPNDDETNPNSDGIILPKTENEDPVTDVWQRKAPDGSGSFETIVVHHSLPYPRRPANGYTYNHAWGSQSKDYYTLDGTKDVAEAEAEIGTGGGNGGRRRRRGLSGLGGLRGIFG